MGLRRRSYLVEASGKLLKKLPPNTEIRDASGLGFSSWDGKLALVSTSSWAYPSHNAFVPKDMTRRYHVRYAIDPQTRKPFPSVKKFLGFEPHVSNRSLPYEKISFSIGGQFDRISGGFDKGTEYLVKLKPKDLFPYEVKELDRYLYEQGYMDVTSEKVSATDWKKAFGMSFADTQEKFPYAKANICASSGHIRRHGDMPHLTSFCYNLCFLCLMDSIQDTMVGSFARQQAAKILARSYAARSDENRSSNFMDATHFIDHRLPLVNGTDEYAIRRYRSLASTIGWNRDHR